MLSRLPHAALAMALVLAAVPALPGAGTAAAAVPTTARCADACRIAGARAYVAALLSHDPDAIPLHPAADRVEAGLRTGFSAAQLRADLRHGPQYRIIRGISDARYVVRDGVVVSDYTLDVGLGPLPLSTARVHETFAYTGGLIRHIVAGIRIGG